MLLYDVSIIHSAVTSGAKLKPEDMMRDRNGGRNKKRNSKSPTKL